MIEADKVPKWLIWSIEHNMWWRANWNGYTPSRKLAGRYTFKEACEIVRNANIHLAMSPKEAMVLDVPVTPLPKKTIGGGLTEEQRKELCPFCNDSISCAVMSTKEETDTAFKWHLDNHPAVMPNFLVGTHEWDGTLKNEMLTKKRVHICVPIDRALSDLSKGINIFTGTITEAQKDLLQAKNEGKTYYTGCDNMDKTGRCAGHIMPLC